MNRMERRMHSTLKLTESDPHDVFAIAPGIVPVAWADKVLADITGDAGSAATKAVTDLAPVKPTPAESSAAGARTPKSDRFRTTAAIDSQDKNSQVKNIQAKPVQAKPIQVEPIQPKHIPDIHIPGDRPAGPPPGGSRTKSAITVFLFALCSAFAAAGWQHYGASARQMISAWTPPFTLTSSQPPEPTGLAGHADTPDAPPSAQASAENQAAPQPAPAQASAAAPSPDAAQLQSMARDLAAMGQEVELLKATVAELKSTQQPVAGDAGKISPAKTSELKPSLQTPRPKMSVPPPPRVAAVSPRKPVQAYPTQAYPTQPYPPVQAAAPPPPLQQFPPPASLQPAPPAADQDGEPVIRPPMPLH
jgi:hypothetical protein